MRVRLLPRSVWALAIGAAVATLVALSAPAASAAQQDVFVAEMTGAQVVGDQGDPDGTGTAVITTDRAAGTLCAVIHTENVTEEAPIYNPIFGILLLNVGPPPVTDPGAVAVVLSSAVSTNPDFEGCHSVSAELIKEMGKYPERFFVQINTGIFDGGAVRGQLTEAPKT
jgi:CHRD domain